MSTDETRETLAAASARAAELEPERGHHLTLTKDDDFDPEWPHFAFEITCLAPSKCGGYEECIKEHAVDGKSAADGPWECDLDDPWCDEDIFTFHGVEHEWRYGWNWTVPFKGCVVAANDSVGDCAHDIGVEHGEGTFAVDDEWDDTHVSLIVIDRVDGSPSQSPSGGAA